ncbi:hypothetical protein RND71_028166 [Anisodus tanguticus]|uniref:Ubiquitin-like domain-containing protein n=1 Tax=Anisodus tanguticus TaxID=243964 RepID=A0AAE1RJ66_9SOLA|nr:hypothetical protein RND71_028166 [Anisodus tanguticus]
MPNWGTHFFFRFEEKDHWKILSGDAVYPFSIPKERACSWNFVHEFRGYLEKIFPVLADGVPRKLAILGSTLFLSFVNYTGLTIVGYVSVALGVISLAPFMRIQALQKIDPIMKHMKTAVEQEKEDEEISIYLRITKAVKLNVKKSDNIRNVKELLHDKEGIRVCLQQLFSEDNRLMDGWKLVDYGICNNSTLHAYVEDLVPDPVILCVKRSYAEGTFTVTSWIYDTIQDVKSRIGAKEGTNTDEFSLIHEGRFLEDDKILAFLNIDDGSTVHMVLIPRDKFLISIVMPTYEIVQIEVKATLFVRDVKPVIQIKVGQSMDDMDLFCGKQKLEDQKEIYLYDIKEDSLLQVVSGTIQIFIRKLCTGEIIMLDVHRHYLVKDVKSMLLNKLGIPVHLQLLFFAGKYLADSRDLASYNIHKDAILYLDICNYTENPTHSDWTAA